MRIAILGGGLAGISLAYFLRQAREISQIVIIEKEKNLGGLCRSLSIGSQIYDIGPHIMFSKDKEILDLMLSLLKDNQHRLRRSNKIIFQDRLINYPFENDLSALSKADLEYCLNTFLHNPYEEYDAENMLQYLLKTFGEGIVNLYLRPYNEKIWKYDPAFLDTQMIGRIPKPPREDIIHSTRGETIDGYLHQLYFHYPQKGGTVALIEAFCDELPADKTELFVDNKVIGISKAKEGFFVVADNVAVESDLLVSTIPLPTLPNIYKPTDAVVAAAAGRLLHNSSVILAVKVKTDKSGNNFTFTVPDKNIIFHRISKIDFLGANYSEPGTASYVIEVSFRAKDMIDEMLDAELFDKVLDGLEYIGFIEGKADIIDYKINRFEYTYVIYDLWHKRNVDFVRDYYANEGIYLNGRFGCFEYWNADRVIRESKTLADKIIMDIQKGR
jgi:protoporphyrinogen oxidase